MSWTPTDEQVRDTAAVIDPVIVEPDRTTVMNAWRRSPMDAEQRMAEREHEAYTKARAVLVAVGPHIAAQAWQEGWGTGYVDRHRERVGDDGHVVRNDPTPNPYSEKGAGR